jgi:hypothetical protein
MPRFCQRAVFNGLWAAVGIVLSTVTAGHAAPIEPSGLDYDASATEDSATKACVLGVLIKGARPDETVSFQLIVARMKRDAAYNGPVVFGYRIEVLGRKVSRGRSSEPRQIKIDSAAFVAERYTAVARPKIVPFDDGSMVASTLEAGEGTELVDAVANGKFQVAFTRRFPTVARTYAVTSAPPLDVRSRFGGCIDGFQPTN